jgi:hypothetical protein
MSKTTWIYIAMGVVTLAVIITVMVVTLRKKADTEKGIIDWIKSETK